MTNVIEAATAVNYQISEYKFAEDKWVVHAGAGTFYNDTNDGLAAAVMTSRN